MYIGLDISVRFTYRKGQRQLQEGWSIKLAKEVNEFRNYIEAISPEDFISAHVVHTDTGQELDFKSRDELIAESYNWLAKPPRAHK